MICNAADLTVESGSSIAIRRISEVKRPCPSRVHNARRRTRVGVESRFPINRWWSETHCSRIRADFDGEVSTSHRWAASLQKPLSLVKRDVVSHRLGISASGAFCRDAFDGGVIRKIRPVALDRPDRGDRSADSFGRVGFWGFVVNPSPMSAMYRAPSGPF